MEIIYTPRVTRQIKKLLQSDRDAIRRLIAELEAWPNDHADIIRLSGREDYRIKKGRHRVIFEVYEEENEIHITYAGLRNERTYG